MFMLSDSKVRKIQTAIMLLICMMAVVLLILDFSTPLNEYGRHFGNYFNELENLRQGYKYYCENSFDSKLIDNMRSNIRYLNSIFAIYLTVSIIMLISAIVLWKFKLPQMFFLPLLYLIVCNDYGASGTTYSTVISFAIIATILMLAYDVLWIVQWVKKKRARVTTE